MSNIRFHEPLPIFYMILLRKQCLVFVRLQTKDTTSSSTVLFFMEAHNYFFNSNVKTVHGVRKTTCLFTDDVDRNVGKIISLLIRFVRHTTLLKYFVRVSISTCLYLKNCSPWRVLLQTF